MMLRVIIRDWLGGLVHVGEQKLTAKGDIPRASVQTIIRGLKNGHDVHLKLFGDLTRDQPMKHTPRKS